MTSGGAGADGLGAPATPRSGSAPSRAIRLFPLVAMELYLNFTVFVFAFGPWEWPVRNGPKLYGFLAAAHAALALGYLSARHVEVGRYSGRATPERILRIAVALSLILLPPTSKSRTGSWIPNVIGGIMDPASAYFEGNDAVSAAGGNAFEYLRILVAPWLFMVLPLSVFYWPRLSRRLKVLAVASVAGLLAVYVARGTNKAFADVVLLLPCLLVARYCAGTLKPSRRQVAAGVVLSVVLFSGFLVVFASGNVARLGDGAGSMLMPTIGLQADLENGLIRDLPEPAKLGALGLSSYVSQGYYGLSLALDEPFEPMFGVGNSTFLYLNAVKVTGIGHIAEMPYPVRLEKNGVWDAYNNWSSIYPWLASDVSFPGVIVIVFIVGWLFAVAWYDTLAARNPYAVALLAQLLIMLFYFPANNQTMQTGEALFSFYGVLGVWWFTRRTGLSLSQDESGAKPSARDAEGAPP